jgi:hypothetical protein
MIEGMAHSAKGRVLSLNPMRYALCTLVRAIHEISGLGKMK